jgi:hypothetical protein
VRPVETVPGMERWKRMVEGVIWCKHFCKCHNVPPVQQ